jgi:hypothetical protein
MTTELLIEYVRGNWLILIVLTGIASYFIYSMIKNFILLRTLKDRKKKHEKELADLEAEYAEKAKQLEEKLKERRKF